MDKKNTHRTLCIGGPKHGEFVRVPNARDPNAPPNYKTPHDGIVSHDYTERILMIAAVNAHTPPPPGVTYFALKTLDDQAAQEALIQFLTGEKEA